jgi:integrase/recombinase XerD
LLALKKSTFPHPTTSPSTAVNSSALPAKDWITGETVFLKLIFISFFSFLRHSGKTNIEEITKDDIEGFIEYEQDRGIKISTVKTTLAQLYAFINYLVENEIVSPQLLTRKMRLKVPDPLPRSMNADDVNLLLSTIKHIRDRALVLMLLRTGMRIGELLNTKVGDINFKEQKVLIYESAKNRLGRVVYFWDDAKEALKDWLDYRDPEKEYLFYAKGSERMTYAAARLRFVKYIEKAGLSHKGYTLHALRHTYATELLNAGMPLECLQQLLGHSNIEKTRIYARLSDQTREEEYFRAMSIIERREKDGHYQLDRELQTFFEEKKLFFSYGEELHEHT